MNDEDKPPSSTSHKSLSIAHSDNRNRSDFWRAFFLYHALHSRGVAHNLLPLLKSI